MFIGTKIRLLREAAGLSQTQLAEAAGLAPGSLRNYEQGRYDPPWEAVFQLAAALGVSADVFAECAGVRMREADQRPRGRPVKGERPPPVPRRGRPRKGK